MKKSIKFIQLCIIVLLLVSFSVTAAEAPLYYSESNYNVNQLRVNSGTALLSDFTFGESYKDQLVPTAKSLYDTIFKMLGNMKDGTSGEEETIDYTLTKSDFDNYFSPVIGAIRADHPELYYIDMSKVGFSYSYNENQIIVTVKTSLINSYTNYYVGSYSSVEELNTEIDLINSKIDEIIEGAKQYKVKYNQIKYCHDWLINNNQYNTYVADNNQNAAPASAWTIKSAFLSNNNGENGPVCEGYSEAFKILCNKLGVECVSILGVGHQWNNVKLNGIWYNVDVTWDDPIGGTKVYNDHFLVGNNTKCFGVTFISKHTPQPNDYLNADFTMPVVSDVKYNPPLIGDANGDGTVDIKDATLIIQYFANWNVIVDEECSDANGDSVIDIKDATLIIQYFSGWSVALAQ